MKIFTLLALLISPLASQAAVFDTADILPENSGALGIFGELLLNDPTSEGVEARGRYGLSNEWNLTGIIGTGSKGKNFRFGGEAVYSILPDWEGQIGLSAMGGAVYLKRPGGGGLQMRVGIMGHKKVDSWTDTPATVYLAIPFYLEGRSGTYNTGMQIVLGSLLDFTSDSRFYGSAEAGVKIGHTESYIALGAGVRFGELRFNKRKKSVDSPSKSRSNEPEYKDADFK